MHLAIPFTLLLGSFVAAAPSFQHAQISVDITNMETQGQVDALYSSDELEVHHGGHHIHKDLPFNFTLSARHASGHPRAGLPFEFERLNGRDSIRGELGFTTIFAFRDGKLISGNRALGYDPRRPWPPWTALWPLEIKEPVQFFHLIGVSESSGGILHYFIEFENRENVFGAFHIKGPLAEFHRSRVRLEAKPIPRSSDDINANSAEELL